jgi:hypothetical protein
MPVARYFLFVGGVLLALLFAVDAFTSQPAVVASTASSIDKTVVRIRSDQKPPERVVYDTSLPTIVPPPAAITAQAAPAPAPAVSPEARVRDTFAQFVPGEAKKPAPQIQRKRKVVRSHPAPSQGSPIRVAQQSQFGFFGAPRWNSTW